MTCTDCGSSKVYRKQSLQTPWGAILAEPRCWPCREAIQALLDTLNHLPADVQAAITRRRAENMRG